MLSSLSLAGRVQLLQVDPAHSVPVRQRPAADYAKEGEVHHHPRLNRAGVHIVSHAQGHSAGRGKEKE